MWLSCVHVFTHCNVCVSCVSFLPDHGRTRRRWKERERERRRARGETDTRWNPECVCTCTFVRFTCLAKSEQRRRAKQSTEIHSSFDVERQELYLNVCPTHIRGVVIYFFCAAVFGFAPLVWQFIPSSATQPASRRRRSHRENRSLTARKMHLICKCGRRHNATTTTKTHSMRMCRQSCQTGTRENGGKTRCVQAHFSSICIFFGDKRPKRAPASEGTMTLHISRVAARAKCMQSSLE